MEAPDYLQHKIETFRKRMEQQAKEKGLTHPDTINSAKKLDDLLNIDIKEKLERILLIRIKEVFEKEFKR